MPSSPPSLIPATVPPSGPGCARQPRDDAAFEELVKAWSRLVFSTALRRLEGDAAGAQEITQNVFLTAFRKLEILVKADCPASWFHRAAMLESSNHLRAERCRRRHLEAFKAAESAAVPGPDDPLPDSLRAHLDEVLNGLRDPDRALVLGRFFEGRSFQELAERRRSTPDAVRVRLNRILEKLARLLKRRGVAISAIGLGNALSAQWTQAAAAGTGAALAAALQGGQATAAASTTTAALTSASVSRAPFLLTLMTSGKTMGVLSLAILIALLALRAQSGRVEDLRSKINRREAVAVSARTPDSHSGGSPSWRRMPPFQTAASVVAPTDGGDNRPVTAGAMLDAVKNANGSSYSPGEGEFVNTRLDETLESLTSADLVKLLEAITDTPAGAGLKSRTRYLLIAKYLADKDPAEAMRQAANLKMPDGAFLTVARTWCRKPGSDGVQTLLSMLDRPDALPSGKFGSDPAEAIRRGMAEGVGLRNLPEALEVCRSAAGTPAAGDYLEGLTYLLAKENRRETLFDLIEGVPEADKKAAVLGSMAANLEIYRPPYPIASWFEDPAFPQELRNQAVMKAAEGIHAFRATFLRKDDEPLRIIAEGSAPGDRLANTLEWMRSHGPKDGKNRSYGLGRVEAERKEDDVIESALRLVATADPELTRRWLTALQNPERREAFARSLNSSTGLKKP